MLQKNKPLFHGLIVAFFCGCIFGYTTGVIPYAADSYLLNIAHDGIPLPTKKTFIISITLFSAIFGSIGAGFIADFYGRRYALLLGVVISTLGNTLCMFALFSFSFMLIGRLVIGIGLGIFSSVGPLYCTEMEAKRHRGAITATYQFFITLGLLVSSTGTFFTKEKTSWIYQLIITFILYLIFGVYLLFVPESPRYIIAFNKEINNQIFKYTLEEDADVVAEKKKIADLASETHSLAEVIAMNRKAISIAICLAICQQFSGVNIFIYYFKEFAEGQQNYYIFFLNTFNSMVALFSVYIVKKVKRVIILICGNMVMTVSLMAATASVFMGANESKWVIIFTCFVFIGGFELGIGPLFYIHVTEMFSERYRGRLACFCVGVKWFCNFTVTVIFSVLNFYFYKNAAFRVSICLVFVAATIVCSFFYAFKMIETRRSSLNKIQKLFVTKDK